MRNRLAALVRLRGPSRVSQTFDRLPIRVRLASVSALLTFVILCVFAVGVGSLTVHRIRSDFNRQVNDNASELSRDITIKLNPSNPARSLQITPPLNDFANTANHTEIRILTRFGEGVIAESPVKAVSLGPPRSQARTVHGYRVVLSPHPVPVFDTNGYLIGEGLLQYGKRVSDTEATVKRVELGLLIGVLLGSGFALLAGMAIARRAMAPIAALTSTAAEIARTRDPSQSVPQPLADDEVAVLARTLEGMLRELDAARGETETMLARQRRFVADASHELRTPLTSVLANLELLAESLHGEQGEAAASALRSSQRMRRLVADLLLLARTDAARNEPRTPCDLARIVVEAAGELGPVSAEHDISLDVHPVRVMGAPDELHRMTINLLENALRHTPPGTEIRVSSGLAPDGSAELVVQDNGPGIPPQLAPTLFERFVRGAGDRGGSFGLGLAIVQAVADSHGGSVTLEQQQRGEQQPGSGEPQTGARFVVRLPACSEEEGSDLDDDRQHHRTALEAVVD